MTPPRPLFREVIECAGHVTGATPVVFVRGARREARGTQAQVLADMAHDMMLEPGWEHGTGTHTRMQRLVRRPLDERQQRGIGIPPPERLERDGSRVLGPRQRPREPLGRRQAQDLLVVNALRVGARSCTARCSSSST